MSKRGQTTGSTASRQTGRVRWAVLALVGAGALAGMVILALRHLLSPSGPPAASRTSTIIPVEYLRGRSPLAMQGAIVLQSKQCFDCHPLSGKGGQGAALDDIAGRVGREQLGRRIVESPAHAPAYGKDLKAAELAALVAFLADLAPGRVQQGGGMPAPAGTTSPRPTSAP